MLKQKIFKELLLCFLSENSESVHPVSVSLLEKTGKKQMGASF
jgi:hypothetical protein